MIFDYSIYEDSVIAVKLSREEMTSEKSSLYSLAIRYLSPENYKDKKGNIVKVTNIMGGETDWFILPYSFGVAIGKSLIEQKVSGLIGFDEDGFKKMVDWLIEMEELSDVMVY